MNTVSPPPAGWYPDPSGRAPFRYWDGARWTEHTDQGTAPAPSAASPNPPATAPTQAPYGQTAPAAYGGGAPAYNPGAAGGYAGGYAPGPAAAAASGPWNMQSFLADLKKADGFALVVLGGLLFIICSFLPWISAASPTQGVAEETANAWDGDAVWLIRGWDLDDARAAGAQGKEPESGTDMIILGPLAVAGAAIAVSSRMGKKKIANVNEIMLGVSGVLGALMIAEVVHVGGVIDDLKAAYTANGGVFEGSVEWGMYLGVLAALVMAGGAVKNFLDARKTGA
ncbi:MAG: DUF2510 domain-containing protein [Actinomycetota bacterium]|nr:DUF2510 domain-containing protein [Actinomycetota bacterium]